MSDPQTRKRPFSLEDPAPLKHIKQSEGSIGALKTQITDIPLGGHTQMDTSVQSLFHPEQKELFRFNTEFFNVKNQIQQILHYYDGKAMLEKCANIMASEANNIPLFSSDQLQQFGEYKQAPVLIQALSPYFNWTNHSVLFEVIGACSNPGATNLLYQFDSQIDSSLPVIDYPIPQPSPNMIPYDTVSNTVLAVKLSTELRNISLQQVFDIQKLLQNQFQLSSYVFQLLAANCTPALYWMIPKCVVSVITSNIAQKRILLHQNDIMDLSIYPGLIYATSNALRIGSLSFLGTYNLEVNYCVVLMTLYTMYMMYVGKTIKTMCTAFSVK